MIASLRLVLAPSSLRSERTISINAGQTEHLVERRVGAVMFGSIFEPPELNASDAFISAMNLSNTSIAAKFDWEHEVFMSAKPTV